MKNRTFILQKLYGMALGMFLIVALSAKAATYTWTNIAGGNWSVAANWSPNQVPGSSDTANVTLAGTYAVTLDVNTNVNNLTIGGAGSGVQTLVADSFDLDATNALINSDGILSMSNSIFTGTLVVTSGAVFSINSVTVDAQVTVENGGEVQLLADGGYSSIGDESAADTNSWLWLQGGAQMTAASGFQLYLFAPMTNSGTCSMTNGQIYIGLYENGLFGGLVNLAGGVINLIDGAGGTSISAFNGFPDYLVNEGTINVTNGGSEIDVGLGLLTGTYNAAAGATVFFTDDSAAGTSAGAGLSLGGSGQYEFYGGLLTLASNAIPNLQYVGGTLALGSNFQGGAITNLALNGSTVFNTLPVTGTLSVTNSILFGSYLITSGAAFSVNGAIVDARVTVENGGELLLLGTTGTSFGNDINYAATNDWLWLQGGAQMSGPSGFYLVLTVPMTNSGTCSLTNGQISIGNEDDGVRNGGLVNLAGGVINLVSGTSIYGGDGFDYLMNEGTINVTDGTSEIDVGLGLLTGSYNAAAGATVQFETDSAAGTSPGPGLTLGGSGQYQFLSGLLTVANYPIPNMMIDGGATLALAADFQGGTITNLTLNDITLSNTLPVTGTFSVTNGKLLGSYLMTSGAVVSANNSALYGSYVVTNGAVFAVDGVTVDAQVTVENGGELQLLTNAGASSIGEGAYGFDSPNYWLWLQDGAQMTAASGFQLYVLSPMTNSGTCSLTNGQILINNDNFYFFGGLVNLPGGVIDLISGTSIYGGFGLDYLVNEGEIDVFSAGTNSTISVDYVTNAATLSVEQGTLDLQSTNLILEPSGTLSVGLNSATDFGSIVYSNTAALDLAQSGTFQVTLNGGYVPAVGSSFTVLLANSSGIFSGAFANFSSPDGAIWQTNYTAASLVLTNVGQMTWATPATITYGTALTLSQLNAARTPSVAGGFVYNPVAGTVLNSGAGQWLTTTFTPSTPGDAPASLQAPITVLKAALDITATNQSKTYGQTFSFAGTEFSASGLVNGDHVTIASIASAGSAPTVPVSDSPYTITINNAVGDAGLTNYVVTYTTGKLTVNPAPLGVTADSTGKTYGQTITFTGSEFVSTALSNSETIGTVTLTSAGAISNAPVSGSPYSIMPSAATGGTFSPGNYAITYTNGTLTVNRAGLTVTANPASRDYGAANPAFSATYSGFVNNETASVVSGTPGFSAPATPTSPVDSYMITPSLGSLTASNYTFGPFVNGTLTITTTPVTITSGITANNKVYGRTTTATLSSNNVVLLGIVNSDAVSLNTNGYVAHFASAGVGNNIAVSVSGLTLSGAGAANYVLTQPASLTANITTATVTITSGITANNKVYDRTTATTLSSNSVVLLGVVSGDTVSLNTNGYVANFASATVGNNIAVTFGGLTLSGASAANYTLTQPGSLTANITAATVTIASGITANNKVYDHTTTATLSSNNVVLLGVITGDAVSLNTNGYIANFASAGAGGGIAVTVSGLTLSGPSAANYALTQPLALTANITAPGVQIFAAFPNIVISWPTNATIFVLNQTASLTPPVTWLPVTNSITVNGTDNTVTINTSNSENQYFELIGAP